MGRTWSFLLVLHFGYTFQETSAGAKPCEGFMECAAYTGYTCKNNKCVCEPDADTGLFRCIPPKTYSDRCRSDQECSAGDVNLYCVKSDTRVCRCKRGFVWDTNSKRCYAIDDDMYSTKFDPVRDLIIPAIIILTIGAMVYLGVKLFCNCGKMCRRRRHEDITRELEEMSATPHQQATWIASYRVFSPYNSAGRAASGLSPTTFPIHPAPCMGLFVPSQTLTASPPPYEEALKHKVILSSYHPPPLAPPYTLPQPELSRQYQTLHSGPSSTVILTQGAPPAAMRLSAVSGPRSLPTQSGHDLSSSHEHVWTQVQYSGTTGSLWSPHHGSNMGAGNRISQEGSETVDGVRNKELSRVGPVEVWTPQIHSGARSLPQSHETWGAVGIEAPKEHSRNNTTEGWTPRGAASQHEGPPWGGGSENQDLPRATEVWTPRTEGPPNFRRLPDVEQ